MTFAAVSTIVQTTTTSLTVNPTATGNFYLAEVVTESATVWASGISGGNCTWVLLGTKFLGTNWAGYCTVFAGTATATGSTTATIAFSGATPSFFCAGQQFQSSAGAWALDGTQGNLDSAAGTATYPSLTPAAAGELYFGFSAEFSFLAVAGSTSGYVYQIDTAASDGMCYNVNCTASAQAPVWGSNCGSLGIAVLLRETPSNPPSNPKIINQAIKRASLW